MKLSLRGLQLLEELEGFRAEPYKDSGGKLTIGFGHLITEHDSFDAPLTREQALVLLLYDIWDAECCVNNSVTVPLTSQQFDTLCLFVFNEGCKQFAHSTLLRLLNSGDYLAVPIELAKWVNDGGQRIEGLVHRRSVEIKLWSSDA